MKTIGFLLLILPLITHQQPTCAKVRTGKFMSGNEQNGFTVITRTKDIQREENEKYGIITEDTVRWLSDCKYKIITGRVIKNESKVDLTTDFKLEIEILEVHESHYKQKTTSLLTGQSMVSEIKIIK
jgi:hypothetical protein